MKYVLILFVFLLPACTEMSRRDVVEIIPAGQLLSVEKEGWYNINGRGLQYCEKKEKDNSIMPVCVEPHFLGWESRGQK